ncbi:hypothetical protein FOL85_08970 [Lactobacillus reuteri]|nr:hypothetical protein [Limosilactobacillus reuteri]NMV56724.1 hypothetical protein [Limosilactobacillus reuteri]NMV65754.1 hypothetical protein [Limosilactobacillus reuteri]
MVTPLKTLMGFSVHLNVQLKFYNLPFSLKIISWRIFFKVFLLLNICLFFKFLLDGIDRYLRTR